MFKLFIPWFWPWEIEKAEPEPIPQWDQERITFENRIEELESPRDKILRLAPAYADLKKLVL